MAQAKRVIAWIEKRGLASFNIEEGLVGGAAYDAHGKAISEDDMKKAMAADAVIFGAVGGPKWDAVPYDVRPEAGLLRLRKDLALFANLRPAICYPALADASSLKRELVEEPRHSDRARTDGRRLFRRAEDDHRSRQRPEARCRYAGL
jgi:3-isopropylmalate dehydrogenase